MASEVKRRGIPAHRVIYYGSSLGGYAALAAASAGHAHAIAEVPQIDFQNWFPGAVKKVEDHILGTPIEQFRAKHPERVDVWERFQFEGHIPSFTIYTNEADKSFSDQVALIGKVRESALYKGGNVELVITARTKGHQVLVKDVATKLVMEALARL